MNQDSVFRTLIDQLIDLGASLNELDRYMRDFGPGRQHTALIDLFHDPIDDLLGNQKEALLTAITLQQTGQSGTDAVSLQRYLVACHKIILSLDADFHEKLSGRNPSAALSRFAREHGKEGAKWVNTVQSVMTGCQLNLNTIHQTLLLCWQSLVTLAAKTYISVQAANNTLSVPASAITMKDIEKGAQKV